MKEKFVQIFSDSETGLLQAWWHGTPKLEDVKFGCEEMARFVGKRRHTHYFSDQTRLEGFSPEVQQYLKERWLVALEQLGTKKVAILVSNKTFSQTTPSFNLGQLRVQTFRSRYACQRWLSRQPRVSPSLVLQ